MLAHNVKVEVSFSRRSSRYSVTWLSWVYRRARSRASTFVNTQESSNNSATNWKCWSLTPKHKKRWCAGKMRKFKSFCISMDARNFTWLRGEMIDLSDSICNFCTQKKIICSELSNIGQIHLFGTESYTRHSSWHIVAMSSWLQEVMQVQGCCPPLWFPDSDGRSLDSL